MTYCVEEMKEFKLLGKAVKHGEGYEAPSRLWRQCHEDGTIKALTRYSTSPGKELIGLTEGASFDEETGLYYVATIYDKDTIPEGYVLKEIPARTWVKFMCGALTERHEDAEIWQRIYSEYFPTSNYVPEEYQMVVNPIGNGNYPIEMGEIWVDVRRFNNVYQ